jgi:hypothetical protein
MHRGFSFEVARHLTLSCPAAARQRRTLFSGLMSPRDTAASFRVSRSQFSEHSARDFGFRRIFWLTLFVRTIFSILCPSCQFWIFLEGEIFQSTFDGEPI